MAAENVTNELMYALLKDIRGEVSRVGDRLDHVEGEMRVMRGHLAALVQADLLRGTDFATLSMRVDRIERRLELTEGQS